ncbi:trypsin family protein, partial [Vibrio parahaemolyticus V-223/04]
MDNERS